MEQELRQNAHQILSLQLIKMKTFILLIGLILVPLHSYANFWVFIGGDPTADGILEFFLDTFEESSDIDIESHPAEIGGLGWDSNNSVDIEASTNSLVINGTGATDDKRYTIHDITISNDMEVTVTGATNDLSLIDDNQFTATTRWNLPATSGYRCTILGNGELLFQSVLGLTGTAICDNEFIPDFSPTTEYTLVNSVIGDAVKCEVFDDGILKQGFTSINSDYISGNMGFMIRETKPRIRSVIAEEISGFIVAQIDLYSDDAEQDINTPYVTINDSSDLEFGSDGIIQQIIGLRFTDLEIPIGSTIIESYVVFRADGESTTSITLTIEGEDTTTPLTFSETSENISSRIKTTASVSWTIPSWGYNEESIKQRTPDIKTIIQEIVDLGTWASGDDIALIISETTPSTITTRAESFDGVKGAYLYIKYL